MKKEAQPRHTGRKIVLLVLLALLCIGTTELIACRHFAPEIYRKITAPVRYAAAAVSGAFGRALDDAGQLCRDTAEQTSRLWDQAVLFWEELTTPKGPEDGEPDSQYAGEPTITENLLINPVATELLEEDGRQLLTGGLVDVVYFCQTDEAWASLPYGSDTIGPYGCGPTAMAMAVATLTDEDTDPAAMAAWAVNHGYWASRSGSYHSIVPGTAKGFGLEVESFTARTPDELLTALYTGKIMVALMGPGHFTQGGHFILIRGATLSGRVLVADPNSLERSLATWDPQLILDELAVRASSGGPLWAITIPYN